MIVLHKHPAMTAEILYHYLGKDIIKSEVEKLTKYLQNYLIAIGVDCPKVYPEGVLDPNLFKYLQVNTGWVFIYVHGFLRLMKTFGFSRKDLREALELCRLYWDTGKAASKRISYGFHPAKVYQESTNELKDIDECINYWKEFLWKTKGVSLHI